MIKLFLISILAASCTYIQVEGNSNSIVFEEKIDADIEAEKK